MRRLLTLVLAFVAPLLCQEQEVTDPQARVLRSGPPVEAVVSVREILEAKARERVPDLYARLEELAGRKRSDAETALLSAIVDALVMLDEEGDGSELTGVTQVPYSRVKVLSYAAVRPEKRWKLIRYLLNHPFTGSMVWEAAWRLAWEHHRGPLLDPLLAPSIDLVVEVRQPEDDPHPALWIHGAGGAIGLGGPGGRHRRIALEPPFVPTWMHEISSGGLWIKPLARLPGGDVIYRLQPKRSLRVEYAGRAVITTGQRLLDELDERLGRDEDGIDSLRPATLSVPWSDAAGLAAAVRDEKARLIDLYAEILAVCHERKWIGDEVAQRKPSFTIQVVDSRPEPREPLPNLDG